MLKFILTLVVGLTSGFIISVFLSKKTKKKNNNNTEKPDVENSYKALLDNLSGTVYRCHNDQKWHMTYISESVYRLTGYTSIEFTNNKSVNYADLIHPEDKDFVWQTIQNTQNKTNNFILEYRIITKDKKVKWVFEQGRIIEINNATFLEGFIIDVSERKFAQNILLESELKLKATLNAIPDLIFRNDINGYYTDFYSGKDSNLLITKEKLIGSHVSNTFSPEFSMHLINIFNECILSDTTQIVDYYIETPKGKEYYEARIVKYNNNEVLSLCRNITRRVQAENEIKQSEEKYRKLFDFANDTIFIIKNGIIINCNNKAIEVFGLTKDNIIGKSPADLSPEYQPNGFKSTEEAVRLISTALKEKATYFEWEHKTGNNKNFTTEISLSAFEIDNEYYLQAIVRDVSQRKIFEKALAESEEKYKTLVEKANDGIAIVQNQKFVFANPKLCEFTGYTTEEVIDRSFFDFIHPDFHKKVRLYNNLRLQKDNTVPNIYEIAAKHKQGHLVNVEINSNIITYNGKPAVLVVVRDSTERKIAENKLRLFKATIDNSSDAIGMSTPDGKHFYQNEAFTKLFGSFDTVNIDSIFKDTETKKNVFNSIMSGKQWIGEVDMVSSKGNALNVFLRAYPNIDSNGNINGLVGIHTDITYNKQAELSLQKNEEKFRMIIELAADAFFQGTTQGDLITVNDQAIKLTGYSKQELLKMNLKDLFVKNSIEAKPLRYDLLEEGMLIKNERQLLRKNGDIISIEMSSRKMPDGTYQSFFRDITDRKKAEHALIQSETKYRLLFENITQGFALHEIITENNIPVNYRYISVNPAFEQLTGIKANNVIGKNIKEIIPNIEDYWIKTFGEVALTGKPINYVNFAADLDKYFETWVFSPKKGQFAVVFSDITERKQAEDTIKALLSITQMGNNNLNEITDYALNECVNLTKSKIAFLAFTNEDNTKIKISSFSKEILTYNKDKNVVLEFDLSSNSLFSECIYSKKPIIINDYNAYLNKKTLPDWHLNIDKVLIVPIEDKNKTVSIVAVANKKKDYNEKDIHQLTIIIDRLWKTIQNKKDNEAIKKLNEDLIEKNKEMEQFVYVTSHDLRSPLVNIQGFTKEFSRAIEDIKESIFEKNDIDSIRALFSKTYDDDITEALSFISQSTKKMDTLLNGLLKLSRMGRIVLNIKPINTSDLFKEILSSFEFQIHNKNIEVNLSNLENCKGDPLLLNQVFSNIIDNAIKYNDKEKGIINIFSKKNNDTITYIIEDNGMGIPQNFHHKIFEIFQRLDNKIEGEGIGLNIVQKIIEKHGGKISIESEVNKGTKFFISLPI